MRALTPFLMFCREHHGQAEEAIELYCSVFEDSRVISIDRYGPGDTEPAGTVRVATFELGGHPVMAIDSAAPRCRNARRAALSGEMVAKCFISARCIRERPGRA